MAVSVIDPDEILIKEHLGGERDAFDVLYRRYFPRLVRLCTRLTKDAAAAEDIAQETLVRAHDHLERFDLGRPMWPWLKTIATRVLIDHTRSTGREIPTEDRPLESQKTEHGWTEEREVLVQALSKLPARQRTAVALRYLEDWDGPQVAEHLGLSGLAFRQILHRARRKLHTEYLKIAEPVMGAILIPVAWLRKLSHEASARARHVTAGPDAIKLVSAAVAVNLVVAATAIFGGAGHDTPPSVGRSAPPNPSAARLRGAPVGDELRGDGPVTGHADASTPPTAAETHAGGASDSADLPGKAAGRGKDVADGFLDPNRDVAEPEDAQIISVAYSPRFASDQTVYAIGKASCAAPQCPPVLFRSADAGASWQRLAATGFEGTNLLLPPAYGQGDDRIFAMGAFGLEVSEDDGASFQPVTTGSSVSTGTAAISPAFNSGDPTILIGDLSLMQYRDDVKAVGPTRPVPGRGPLYPVYSPAFGADGLILVGGLQVERTEGGWTPTVFRCSGEVCTGSPLGVGVGEPPRVAPAPDFAESGTAYAFTASGLFVSNDRAETFSELNVPWQAPIRDVAVSDNRRLFAAVQEDGREALGELYSSPDGGLTWALMDHQLLSGGITSIRVSDEHVLAALHSGGIACSADGGATWASRCPVTDPNEGADRPAEVSDRAVAPIRRPA